MINYKCLTHWLLWTKQWWHFSAEWKDITHFKPKFNGIIRYEKNKFFSLISPKMFELLNDILSWGFISPKMADRGRYKFNNIYRLHQQTSRTELIILYLFQHFQFRTWRGKQISGNVWPFVWRVTLI